MRVFLLITGICRQFDDCVLLCLRCFELILIFSVTFLFFFVILSTHLFMCVHFYLYQPFCIFVCDLYVSYVCDRDIKTVVFVK